MKLPKYLTTVTPLSKAVALFLFFLMPLAGYEAGTLFQAGADELKMAQRENTIRSEFQLPHRLPQPTSISSPHKEGWFRYISPAGDFYFDYPKGYTLSREPDGKILVEKNTSQPHVTTNFFFIKAGSYFLSSTQAAMLKSMAVGESKAIIYKNSLPPSTLTYERLSDTVFANVKARSYTNRNPWEFPPGTTEYLYIPEVKTDYFFGGFTTDGNEEHYLTLKELEEIVSTVRFLE